MKILYLTKDGKYTDDPSKAIHEPVKDNRELKVPRFIPHHDGHQMVWEERECGQPNRSVSTKAKSGNDAEKDTSKRTRSAKSASKKD